MRAFNPDNIPKLDPEKYDFVKDIAAPLILDIGCGTGQSSVKIAKDSPNHIVIGIERTKDKFSKFLKNEQLPNLYKINEDAIPFISQFVKDNSVDKIFILYPNPYPKLKQANKRFHNMPFMSELLKKMRPGATINQATNILSYHEEARQIFQETWGLKLVSDSRVESGCDRTLFEKKYLERGETCYELVFT